MGHGGAVYRRICGDVFSLFFRIWGETREMIKNQWMIFDNDMVISF